MHYRCIFATIRSIKLDLAQILNPAKQTAQRLGLNLDDLLAERINFLLIIALMNLCNHWTKAS